MFRLFSSRCALSKHGSAIGLILYSNSARVGTSWVSGTAQRRCLGNAFRLIERWSHRPTLISKRVKSSRTPETGQARNRTEARPSWSELRKLFTLAYSQRTLIALAMVALIVSAATNLVMPMGIGKLMDSALADSDKDNENGDGKSAANKKSELTKIALLLLGVFGIGALAMFTRIAALNVAAERMVADLRRRTFRSVIRQEMAFFDNERTGELINRLSSDTVVISRTLTDEISFGIRRIAEGLGGVGLLFYLSPKLTFIMLSVIPPVFLGAFFYGRAIKKLSEEVQLALAKTTNVAEEKISAIRTVRAFVREAQEVHLYSEKVQEAYQIAKKTGILSGAFYGGVGLAANCSMLVVLYNGGSMVLDSAMSIGDLTSFLLYSLYVGFAMSGSANFYGQIMKGAGASKRLFELLERQPQIPIGSRFYSSLDDASDDESNACLVRPERLLGNIHFQNVQFVYPSRSSVPIFHDLNLTIEAGTSVAVVGPSGSGKSTLAGLISRFYDPDQGEVLIDGYSTRSLDPSWIRESIGLVAQEPVLFTGTIKENIAYGLSEHMRSSLSKVEIDAMVINAAREAMAHDFIEAFPDGYDTFLGEKGAQVSGGQKQRLAIARAIIKKPKILVLDEATSALDAQTEYQLQRTLSNMMDQKSRTTIAIAHRLSTVVHATKIVVLKDGRVVEEGPHSELLSREGGIYHELVKRQLR